jgi:hypothetical protein
MERDLLDRRQCVIEQSFRHLKFMFAITAEANKRHCLSDVVQKASKSSHISYSHLWNRPINPGFPASGALERAVATACTSSVYTVLDASR